MKRKCAINICFAEQKAEVWGKSPRKKTRGIRPRRCSPSLQDAKYITVTQDSSPSLCSERPDEISVWQSETGGLGQVTMKKKVFLDPERTRETLGALEPAVVLLPLGCKIFSGHSRHDPKWYSRRFQQIFVWPGENLESGASDQEKTRKAPGALDPAVVLPPPWGCKISYDHSR